MRILCVHQGFELYGSDRCFVNSVATIRKLFPAARIEVLLPHDGPLAPLLAPICDDLRVAPLWVVRKRRLSRLLAHGFLSFPVAFARALARFRRSDLVYINTIVILDYLLAARFFRGKTLLHVHEVPGGVVGAMFRAIVRAAGAPTIFNSEATRDAYSLKDRASWYVLYNGIRGPSATTSSSYDGVRPLRLLMLGKLSHAKGQDILIEACARLPQSARAAIEVRIVGDTFGSQLKLEKDLHALAKQVGASDIIRFEPFVEDPSPLYDWSDLAIVPSRVREGFGRVPVEAMAHARASIVAAHGGLSEIVLHEETGWRFTPNSPNSLAAMILRAVECPESVQKYGQAGRRRFESLFAADLINDRFREILLQQNLVKLSQRAEGRMSYDRGPTKFGTPLNGPAVQSSQEAERAGSDLAEAISVLRRYWDSVLSTCAATMLGVVLYLAFVSPTYVATTQILVDPSLQRSLDDGATINPGPLDMSAFVDSQLRLLESERVLHSVVVSERLADDSEFGAAKPTSWIELRAADVFRWSVTRIATLAGYRVDAADSAEMRALPKAGLGKSAAEADSAEGRALGALKAAVRTKRPDRSFVVDVSVSSHDRQKSAQLANALADAYLQDQSAAQSEAAQRMAASLSARLSYLRNEVKLAEEVVERYKFEHNTAVTPGAPATLATNEALVGLRELERNRDASRGVYESFLKHALAAAEQATLDRTFARVISRALPPATQSWPRRGLLLSFSLVGGLALGGTLAFVRNRSDMRIYSPRQLFSRTDIPVLAVIPKVRPTKCRPDAVFHRLRDTLKFDQTGRQTRSHTDRGQRVSERRQHDCLQAREFRCARRRASVAHRREDQRRNALGSPHGEVPTYIQRFGGGSRRRIPAVCLNARRRCEQPLGAADRQRDVPWREVGVIREANRTCARIRSDHFRLWRNVNRSFGAQFGCRR